MMGMRAGKSASRLGASWQVCGQLAQLRLRGSWILICSAVAGTRDVWWWTWWWSWWLSSLLHMMMIMIRRAIFNVGQDHIPPRIATCRPQKCRYYSWQYKYNAKWLWWKLEQFIWKYHSNAKFDRNYMKHRPNFKHLLNSYNQLRCFTRLLYNLIQKFNIT